MDLLDAGEHARLREWGNRAVLTQPAPTSASIPVLWAAQVARNAAAVALTFEGRSLTYRELDAAATRLAHLLAGHGVGPGSVVALLLSRSAEAIVAILAVLKTGAAYLPIDPGLPANRVEFMLADAAPIAAITTATLAHRIDGHDLLVIDVSDIHDSVVDTQPPTALPAPGPDDIAYFIYTSGTTGIPKGVAITHHNITQLVAALHAQAAGGSLVASLVAVAFAGLRRLGVGDLGRTTRWRTTRHRPGVDDPLTRRFPCPTCRRARHRPEPDALGVLRAANRLANLGGAGTRTATAAEARGGAVRRRSAGSTASADLAAPPPGITAAAQPVRHHRDHGARLVAGIIPATRTTLPTPAAPSGCPSRTLAFLCWTGGCVRCPPVWWGSCTSRVMVWALGIGVGRG